MCGGDLLDELAVDGLEFSSSGAAESFTGDTVDVAQATVGGLVEHGDGVGGKGRGLSANALEPVGDVFAGICWNGVAELDPGMDARPEGAILAQLEAVVHFGQTDEEDAEQGQAIPFVVGQDVQMVEDILVEQVGLVEQKHRVEALLAELLDVTGDFKENGSCGCFGREPERETELSIEVATTERSVVAVGEPEASFRQALLQSTQDAGFADARLAGEEHVSALGARLDQLIDDLLPGRGKPQVGRLDFLGERW